MNSDAPGDSDRAAIADQAQRTVERVALRKIRKTLDEFENAQKEQRRALRFAVIVCALLLAFGSWILWSMFSNGAPKTLPVDMKALRQSLEKKQ